MQSSQPMSSIHNVESMIKQDEILRYRSFQTAYIVLIASLTLMMGVGGIYLYFLPELELVGITLVLTALLIGAVYMIALKLRGIVGAASEVVLSTREQRKAARNEIMIRGALFAVFMTVFTWFTDDEASPVKLAFTGVFNFVFWSLGMYAYYVIRGKRKSARDASEGDAV